MTRRCSHCGRNGHNSRTCPDRGLKPLVKTDEAGGACMRKSFSMATLSSPPPSPPAQDPPHQQSHTLEHTDGCTSDGMVQGMAAGSIAAAALRERKKGIPWTEEEHRMFLLGLQKLGKGDWRGISRSFVTTRTPTQVASHAQKYFIRQTNLTRRKRRSSLFDITVEGEEAEEEEEGEEGDEENHVVSSNKGETKVLIPDASPTSTAAANLVSEGLHPAILPSAATPFLPYPFPIWAAAFMSSAPPPLPPSSLSINSNVVKPTATLSTAPIKLDAANGLSRLISSRVPSSTAVVEPSPLSLKLLRSSRSSAFHASPGFASNHLHGPNKLGSGSGSAAISVVQ